MTEQIPDVVRSTIKALRTAATWLPDEQRDMLHEAATVAENGGWEDACCPICQETWCDAGCPLEDLRGELLRNAEQERLREPPVVTPMGSGVKLMWPDWEPFHRPAPGANGGELARYAEAKRKLASSLREMSNLVGPSPLDDKDPDNDEPAGPVIYAYDMVLPSWAAFGRAVSIALDPPYQRPVLPASCYTASFGRVHVRPGCRC